MHVHEFVGRVAPLVKLAGLEEGVWMDLRHGVNRSENLVQADPRTKVDPALACSYSEPCAKHDIPRYWLRLDSDFIGRVDKVAVGGDGRREGALCEKLPIDPIAEVPATQINLSSVDSVYTWA